MTKVKKKRTSRSARPGGAWISVDGTPYAVFDDRRVADLRSNLVTGSEADRVLCQYDAMVSDYTKYHDVDRVAK